MILIFSVYSFIQLNTLLKAFCKTFIITLVCSEISVLASFNHKTEQTIEIFFSNSIPLNEGGGQASQMDLEKRR